MSDEALTAAETSASPAASPSIDLLHSTTSINSSQLQQQQQQLRRHLPHHFCHRIHGHREPSSTLTRVGGVDSDRTQADTDSDTEAVHGHCCCSDAAAEHAVDDDNYLPR